MKIFVSKANDMPQGKAVESGEIHIVELIPDRLTLDELNDHYNDSARDIYNVLKTSLPQATMQRLLIEIVKGQLSFLKYSILGMESK